MTGTIDPLLPAPAAEVPDAVGDAAAAYDRLTACGVRLHFQVDDQSAELTVLACDEQGTVLGSLSPSTVVELASRGTSTNSR